MLSLATSPTLRRHVRRLACGEALEPLSLKKTRKRVHATGKQIFGTPFNRSAARPFSFHAACHSTHKAHVTSELRSIQSVPVFSQQQPRRRYTAVRQGCLGESTCLWWILARSARFARHRASRDKREGANQAKDDPGDTVGVLGYSGAVLPPLVLMRDMFSCCRQSVFHLSPEISLPTLFAPLHVEPPCPSHACPKPQCIGTRSSYRATPFKEGRC